MKTLRPLKAIRAKCLDCSGGSQAEVRNCDIEDCPLWPYRMGHNPARTGKGGRAMIRALEKGLKTSTQLQTSDQKMASSGREAK